jgi:hypothetical protein
MIALDFRCLKGPYAVPKLHAYLNTWARGGVWRAAYELLQELKRFFWKLEEVEVDWDEENL